LSKRRKVRIYF